LATNYILQTEIAKHRLGREGILITGVRLMQVGLPVLVKWLLGLERYGIRKNQCKWGRIYSKEQIYDIV
jgi:hypothetical protein